MIKNQAASLFEVKNFVFDDNFKVKTLAISSGKGGVGKTNLVVNLGVALSRMGLRVAIFDADYGLGNIDILLGIDSKKDISSIFTENLTIEEIMIERDGLIIVPAGSGIQNLTSLKEEQEAILHREMKKLEKKADILIIDTAAGISNNVISLLLSSDDIILTVNSEPTSLIDSYAVLKVVSELNPFKNFSLVSNMVKDEKEGMEVYLKMSKATKKFLNKEISYIGFIRKDEKLLEAVRRQAAVMELFPRSASSIDFNKIAKELVKRYRINK